MNSKMAVYYGTLYGGRRHSLVSLLTMEHKLFRTKEKPVSGFISNLFAQRVSEHFRVRNGSKLLLLLPFQYETLFISYSSDHRND